MNWLIMPVLTAWCLLVLGRLVIGTGDIPASGDVCWEDGVRLIFGRCLERHHLFAVWEEVRNSEPFTLFFHHANCFSHGGICQRTFSDPLLQELAEFPSRFHLPTPNNLNRTP